MNQLIELIYFYEASIRLGLFLGGFSVFAVTLPNVHKEAALIFSGKIVSEY
ncbi:MAG: hypothetical protein L3J46_06325 [Kangiellaceae bacterium]|nr:hypothetical protein [Kangiellaceae bacterium]